EELYQILLISERKRGHCDTLLTVIKDLDCTWKKLSYQLQELQTHINTIQKKISKLKQKDCDPETLHLLTKDLLDSKLKSQTIKENVENCKNSRNEKMKSIGNIVHSTVVDSQDEKDNEIIYK